MTNPADYPLNDNAMINLADASRLDDITAYARYAATTLIAHAHLELHNLPDHDELIDNDRIARSISSDELESASFTTLPIDPELLFALISAILCDRLDCADSALCADY